MSGQEKRLHRRIGGVIAAHAAVVFEGGRRWPVKNISYGGFALAIDPADAANFRMGEVYKVQLTVLGSTVATEVRPVNANPAHVGFAIIHSGIDALIFLRGIFEYWQNGNSSRVVLPKERGDSTSGQHKIYINGDGPSDLVITLAKDDTVQELIFTFMADGAYAHLAFKNGKISTGTADRTQVATAKFPGASLTSDSDANLLTVRRGVCLLAGMEIPQVAPLIAGILAEWIKILEK